MSDFRNNTASREARLARLAESAAKGRSEAEAEARHVEENTRRLRALRLAKEAADREAAASAPPKPAKSPRRKPAKKPAAKARSINVEDLNAEDDGEGGSQPARSFAALGTFSPEREEIGLPVTLQRVRHGSNTRIPDSFPLVGAVALTGF